MTLETPRLVLREFVFEDWVATQRYETDPDVVRYQSFDVMDASQSKDYIRKCIEEAKSPSRRTYDLAMTLKPSDEVVGRIGLHLARPEWAEGLLWYVLRQDCWNQGLMTEAASAMLQFGFDRLALRRVVADTDPANIGSIRVLQKLGFRQEGHFIQNQWIKGRWVDTLSFAILAEEFHV